jgi:hypothetical protein
MKLVKLWLPARSPLFAPACVTGSSEATQTVLIGDIVVTFRKLCGERESFAVSRTRNRCVLKPDHTVSEVSHVE